MVFGIQQNSLSNDNFIDCTGLFYILDIINVNLAVKFRAVLQSWFWKSSAS